MRGQFRIFRFAGISVYLHWSWFLVAVFEIQARVGAYTAPGWNILEYLSLFAIVTMHEFGHALACRSVGGTPDRIMLWPFGGVAYVDPPQRPGATLWSLAAGPLVNVALVPVLAILMMLRLSGNLGEYIYSVELINLGLLIFNLLPIYPLDGGQILRSLLWYKMGRARSLMTSTIVGLVGVAAVIVLALRSLDIWLLAITAYIAMTCWSGFQQARTLLRISRLPRLPGLSCPSCHTAPFAGNYWHCPQCAANFNIFNGGACPGCGHTFPLAACLDCGRAAPLSAWGQFTPAQA
ncbi:MAG TPA: M50 family metallopeptidase [Terriglobales bacterium]|nr:M50 family metallopeptidase [Terriglobales bacterium]